MKFFSVLALTCVISISSAFAAEKPANGWTKGKYKGKEGSREYFLYLPQKYNGKNALPLVVMLHGCLQDVTTFSKETGMNNIAEKYGFAVLYPEQTYQDNVWKCWNWFKPENQTRGGELAIVAGMVQQLKKSFPVNEQKVFVAGLSAGGAMASNLAACYNDIFSGAAVHSGMEFSAAKTEAEAHQVTKNGSTHDIRKSAIDASKCSGANAKPMAIITFHGKDDNFVNTANSDNVVKQFTKMNDLLDNKIEDDSQNLSLITSREDQVTNGYRYLMEFFGGGGNILLQKVSVYEMKHAWSGAHQAGQYADVKGPNASEMLWIFLSNYSVKRSK
jgi:poly(hydroxyalkanoate) depolymerase family esterase